MARISWVAYAVDDSASEEKTASPTVLPIAWCGASAVGSGRPSSHSRHEELRLALDSRWSCASAAPGRTNEVSFTGERGL